MPEVSKLLWSLNLDIGEISQKTGIPSSRIAEILELEKIQFGELRALARGLRLPLNSFAEGKRPVDSSDELNLLFRSAGEFYDELEPTKEFVANYVQAALDVLPKKNKAPDWLETIPKVDQTAEEAENLANFVRDLFYGPDSINPLTDLAVVLSKAGSVVVGKLRNSKYEGVSLIAGNRPFIFVSPRFPARMLFTLAHELGHILAHHIHKPGVLFERPSQIASMSPKRKKDESFVDMFAASLLLPAQGVGRMLKSIKETYNTENALVGDIELLLLARFYGVSFEVAGIRCENLGLLPSGATRAIYESLKGDFGSPEKRADQVGLPKRATVLFPELSPELTNEIVSNIYDGNISSGWVSDKFGLSLSKIYSLHKEMIHENHS